jgi:hypothetical protein
MVTAFFPLQYMVAALALWLNRQQQELIDYLKEENRLLKQKLGDRKLHFADAERQRLARRAKYSAIGFSPSSIRGSHPISCYAGTEN